MYLIWSWRHSMWWGPNREGYTLNPALAGEYPPTLAGSIVVSSGLPGNNTAVHVEVARNLPRNAKEIEEKLNAWRSM